MAVLLKETQPVTIIIRKQFCWVTSGRLSWDHLLAPALETSEPNWSITTSETSGSHVPFVPIWLPSAPRQAGPAIGLDSVLILPWGSLLLLPGNYSPDLRGLRKNGLTVGAVWAESTRSFWDVLCACMSLALEFGSTLLSLDFRRICRVTSYFIEQLFQQWPPYLPRI